MSVRKDAIGVTFELTIEENSVALDVSSATVKRIDFEKPDGSVLQKTATFVTDGTDGKISYASVSGDLDMLGAWQMQAYLEVGSFKGYSSISSFQVLANLT